MTCLFGCQVISSASGLCVFSGFCRPLEARHVFIPLNGPNGIQALESRAAMTGAPLRGPMQ
jgi:hypothetical protein